MSSEYTLPNKCYEFPDNGVRLVDSLQNILKDGDVNFLWIRPLSFRGSGVAFVVEGTETSDLEINVAFPMQLRCNNKITFSVKQLSEYWEVVEPDLVMEEHVIIAKKIEEDYIRNG
jgi:hypothetical protein